MKHSGSPASKASSTRRSAVGGLLVRVATAAMLVAVAVQGTGWVQRSAAAHPGRPDLASVAAPFQTVVGWASNSLTSVPADESALGVGDGMLSTYTDFSGAFPGDFAAAAKARGSALLIAWEPWDMTNSSTDQPQYKPTAITAGSYDAYLRTWLASAESAAAEGVVLVRFAPEMNDDGRPWSVGTNGGNTAQDYIDMWRHVYAIKQSVAPHVSMVWNPLVTGSGPSGNPVALSSVFPGADQVDALALDGFNWGAVRRGTATCGWQSYSDVFSSAVSTVKSLSGGKPWGIAEVASASEPDSDFESGGVCYSAWGSWVYQWPQSAPYYSTPSDWITQAGWIKTMIEQAHENGALFVNLFNTQKETDWRLNSTAAGAAVLPGLAPSGNYLFGAQNSSAYLKAALHN